MCCDMSLVVNWNRFLSLVKFVRGTQFLHEMRDVPYDTGQVATQIYGNSCLKTGSLSPLLTRSDDINVNWYKCYPELC